MKPEALRSRIRGMLHDVRLERLGRPSIADNDEDLINAIEDLVGEVEDVTEKDIEAAEKQVEQLKQKLAEHEAAKPKSILDSPKPRLLQAPVLSAV